MIDNRLRLLSTSTVKVYDNTGTTSTWVNNSITVGGHAAITASGNTGVLQVLGLFNLGQSLPFRGFTLCVAGGGTTTGGPTAVQLPLTVAFSDDGSTINANAQTITGVLQASVVSNVITNFQQFLALPRQFNHKYIRVAYGSPTFTGGSTPTVSFTPIDFWLDELPDFRTMTDMA